MIINRLYVYLIEQFNFKKFQYDVIKSICEDLTKIDDNDLFLNMIDVCNNPKCRNKRTIMLECVEEYIEYFNSKFNNLYYPILNGYDKLRLLTSVNIPDCDNAYWGLKWGLVKLYREKISNDMLELLDEIPSYEVRDIFINTIDYDTIYFLENTINNYKYEQKRKQSSTERVYDYFKYVRKDKVVLDDDIRNELVSEVINYAYQVYLENKETCDKNAKDSEEYKQFEEREYYNNWGFDDTCSMSDEEYKEALEREQQEVIYDCYQGELIVASRLLRLSKDYKFDINNVFNKIMKDYNLDGETEILDCFNNIYNIAQTMSDDEIDCVDDYYCIDDNEKDKLKDIEYYTEELGYYLAEGLSNYGEMEV